MKSAPAAAGPTFDALIARLAEVMEEAGAFGGEEVEAEFGGHEGHEVGNFDGMVEHILGEAVAESEPAEDFDNLDIHGRQADALDGVFAGAEDALGHLLADLGHDLFDAGRMNAAVEDEPFHRFAADLAFDGVEAGEHDGVGGVVDEDGDAGGIFKGTDVAALAADDAALEFLVGQGDGGAGGLEGVFAGVTLNGQADDAAAEAGGGGQGLLLDFLEQLDAGLGLAEMGLGLELIAAMGDQFGQLLAL